VTLAVELGGFGKDSYGGARTGFPAMIDVIRHDFGISWNAVIEGGGVVVGDKVSIRLESEAVPQP
jgi:polyisoprenoid-binding protein YceI